jgi:hypothetical protein
MTDEIRPRIDKNGVGWCNKECPCMGHPYTTFNTTCWYPDPLAGEVCPVHARRMAQWAERAREILPYLISSIPRSVRDDVLSSADVEQLLRDYPGKDGGE